METERTIVPQESELPSPALDLGRRGAPKTLEKKILDIGLGFAFRLRFGLGWWFGRHIRFAQRMPTRVCVRRFNFGEWVGPSGF